MVKLAATFKNVKSECVVTGTASDKATGKVIATYKLCLPKEVLDPSHVGKIAAAWARKGLGEAVQRLALNQAGEIARNS